MLYRPKDRERVPEEASGEPLEQLEPPSGAAAPAWTPAPETPPPAPAPTPKPVPTLGPETDLHRRLRRERAKKAVAALLKSSAPAQAEQAEATFKPKTAKEKLALQYAVAGADALDRKEFVTALGNFELALELTPEDPELLKAVERARREARVALSSTYERQGAFEEDLRQYVKAAQSFMKALDVQTENHQLMERAARNLLLGGGNLRKARELASKAVEADRTNVDYRITLGEILLKAGLAADAGREFDEVRRVDPGNERLARLVGRGG
jgi:tetratricopeptide (TPR) repeat protein